VFFQLHRSLRRGRRRVVVAAALLALSGAVVLAHGALSGHHVDEPLALCLAVAETAALSAALLVARRAPPAIRRAWPPAPARLSPIQAARGVAVPDARAGPTFLQVVLR